MYTVPSSLWVKNKKIHKAKEIYFEEAFWEVGISNQVTVTAKDIIKFCI